MAPSEVTVKGAFKLGSILLYPFELLKRGGGTGLSADTFKI